MASPKKAAKSKNGKYKTVIRIKYNCGFPNNIYIRGSGADLSWSQGQLMVNSLPDEWVWGTDAEFTLIEFKILLNDLKYETGENHLVGYGEELSYCPRFD